MSPYGLTLADPVCEHDPATFVVLDASKLCPICDAAELKHIQALIRLALRRKGLAA